MARVLVSSYMVRYPLGGNMAWTLQWLVGLQRIGHDVYLLEKTDYPDACFDPARHTMSDDCSYGMRATHELLARFGLDGRWCFVDARGEYHGIRRRAAADLISAADVLIDIGNHGAWLPEADAANVPTVLVDGEPGYNQMRMEQRGRRGDWLPEYDHYYSNGANIGTPRACAPDAGRTWRPLFNPVVVDLYEVAPPRAGARFTTVMNWQAHQPLEYDGRAYGQKDVEFERFLALPRMTAAPLEVAVSGAAPVDRLQAHGWAVRDAHEVTGSFDCYRDYIAGSLGEFSVAKHVFVGTCSGWFSDRSAAYLAAGRPVVLQDTGFSAHLPCGRGLFAVHTVDEAAAALDEIRTDWPAHSRWAHAIAHEHLSAPKLLSRLLSEVGIA